jgi:hypothetical protein
LAASFTISCPSGRWSRPKWTGHRPLGGIERGKRGEEGTHLRACIGITASAASCRSGRVAGQRQHEGAHAPGGAVLPPQLILDAASAPAIAADRLGQARRRRSSSLSLARIAKLVVALRLRRIAEQIVRKAAVGGDLALGNAERRAPLRRI